MIRQTTPAQITDKIKNFCQGVAQKEPFYVKVKPSGKHQECFFNCSRFLSTHPGYKIVFGWIIWEAPWILEMEQHSIIQTPDGDFLDVTPQADGEESILFLPDDSAAPSFILVVDRPDDIVTCRKANITFPKTQSKTQWVITNVGLSQFKNSLSGLNVQGPKSLEEINATYDSLSGRKLNTFSDTLEDIVSMLEGGSVLGGRHSIKKTNQPLSCLSHLSNPSKEKLPRNSPCHCGSGEKYKKCCLEKDLKGSV
jgi:hypothetical protein